MIATIAPVGFVQFVVADAAPKVVQPLVVFHELFFEPGDKQYGYFVRDHTDLVQRYGPANGRPRGHWNRFGDGRIKVFMTDAQLDRLAQWLEDK